MSLRRKLVPVAVLALLAALAMSAGTFAAAHARSASAVRVWKESITAPAQFDLSLAELRFGAPAHVASRSRAAHSVGIAAQGPTGLDYVAAAVTRFGVLGRPRVLVLVVNRRPRGSLAPDIARVRIEVTVAKSLGRPIVSQVSDPFTRSPIGLRPALCDLPIRGVSLAARDLRPVLGRGLPLSAFSAEAAIAQAYDAVCGRPYDQAFRQAVTQSTVRSCETAQSNILPCCPPNAICAPPPCPPCPCGPVPCTMPVAQRRKTQARPAIVVCPQQAPPIACPL